MSSLSSDVLRCVADLASAVDVCRGMAGVCRAWRDAVHDRCRVYRAPSPDAPWIDAMMRHAVRHAARAHRLWLVVPPNGGCVAGLALLTTLAWAVDWTAEPLPRDVCVAIADGPYATNPTLPLLHAIRALLGRTLGVAEAVAVRQSPTLVPLAWILPPALPPTLRRLHLDGVRAESPTLPQLVSDHLESLSLTLEFGATCRHVSPRPDTQDGCHCQCGSLLRLAGRLRTAARLRSLALDLSYSTAPVAVLRGLLDDLAAMPSLRDLDLRLNHNPHAGGVVGVLVPPPALERLRLGLCHINLDTRAFVRGVLPLLRTLPRLRRLAVDASHNDVGDGAVVAAAAWTVGRPAVLTDVSVDLSHNRLSPSGREHARAMRVSVDAGDAPYYRLGQAGDADPDDGLVWQD